MYVDRSTAAHFGGIPVGIVDTGVVTLVDPLPEDHLLEGLVWEEQANHLQGGGERSGGQGRRGEGEGGDRRGGKEREEEGRRGEGRGREWREEGIRGEEKEKEGEERGERGGCTVQTGGGRCNWGKGEGIQ